MTGSKRKYIFGFLFLFIVVIMTFMFVRSVKADSNPRVEYIDGSWRAVVNGEIDPYYTGIAGNEYGDWYMENGQVCFDTWDIKYLDNNGDAGWWLIEGGLISYETKLAPNEYGWWYVRNGKVDFSVDTITPNEYGWWYVKGGQVRFDYTGIAPNEYGWWRIVAGKVDFDCNSVECNEYGWWYCLGGKVQFDYTGIAPNEYGWWRIVDGAVDFNCNSVECNEYGWWYCLGGKVQFDYTGVAPNQYGWWRIENGGVNFSYNGLASNEYGTWFIEYGKVNFNRQGCTYWNGTGYYITGGGVSGTMEDATVLKYAQSALDQCGWNISDAFYWVAERNWRVPTYSMYSSSAYALDFFKNGGGQCEGFASAFAWMARLLGYNCTVCNGYNETSAGWHAHAWTQITLEDGSTYICDPQFQNQFASYGYTGYMITYGQKNTLKYVMNSWSAMSDF